MESLTFDSCSKTTATSNTWIRKSAVTWGRDGLDFEAGHWIATLGQMHIVDGCAGFVLEPMGSSGDASTVVRMCIVDGCAGFVLKPMGSSGDASTVVKAVPVRKSLRLFWMMTVMRRRLISHGCGCG